MNLEERPRSSAGTYGFLGVLRHPSRIVRPPAAAQSQADLEALRHGETRRVSCSLRGSFGPYARRLRQGALYLSTGSAQWIPFWSVRRNPQQITGPVQSVTTRPSDRREWNIKKGGTAAGGLVTVPSFTVVTCQTPSGTFDLVVPEADVPLVVGYFKSASPAA